jgi:hypothetical protein
MSKDTTNTTESLHDQIESAIEDNLVIRTDNGQPYIFYADGAVEAIQAILQQEVLRGRVELLEDLKDVGEIHHSVYDYRLEELNTLLGDER